MTAYALEINEHLFFFSLRFVKFKRFLNEIFLL